MSNFLTERQVLNQLDIPDFRHITKDKVMSFASMLQNMEPEVAKKALGQFPEFAKMTLEILREYKGVLEKPLMIIRQGVDSVSTPIIPSGTR
jgi:hypothetical protein